MRAKVTRNPIGKARTNETVSRGGEDIGHIGRNLNGKPGYYAATKKGARYDLPTRQQAIKHVVSKA
ncbi:MAG: hypothetical protein ACR2RF_14770 [Geminicoccaceae bacterium]